MVEKWLIKEIDFDKNTDLCKEYNVTGVPTTMIYNNKNLLHRHLGELSNKELDSIFERISGLNNKTR